MTRIAVSDNMIVDYSEDRWRLIRLAVDTPPILLVEVKAGKSFRYDDYFGTTRALPPLGEVATGDIGEVVLGWSDESGAWQLGMTLALELSLSRSSRWFEVLRVADPDHTLREQVALQIGQALAQVLDKPFVASAPMGEPEPEPIPLVDLPLDLGIWQVHGQKPSDTESAGDELRLLRGNDWMHARLRQISWYGLLAAIYLWVSIASLSHDLGLPNAGTLIPDPSLLPYLGIVVGILLLLQVARQFALILREPNTLVVSSDGQSISALRGDQLRWKIEAAKVQSVYASELVKKRGKQPVVYHGEINLHMIDGNFRRVVVEADKHSDFLLPGVDAEADKQKTSGVSMLEAGAVSTALQAAAVHIAVCLGDLPVWYDRRLK